MNKLLNHIQTYSGKAFSPFDPVPENVDIYDIAHALSYQCRFSGHTKHFYSVAQHCYFVSLVLPDEYKLAGLLHDASEAYIVDIPSPVKRHPDLSLYKALEHNVMTAIGKALGMPEGSWWEAKEIHEADLRLCATEARDLMSPWNPNLIERWQALGKPYDFTLPVWSPGRAKTEFLRRYYKLSEVTRGLHKV